MAERFEAFSESTIHALQEFKRMVIAQDDRRSTGKLAEELALIWRNRLGPKERLFLCVVGTLAVEGTDLSKVSQSLSIDQAFSED